MQDILRVDNKCLQVIPAILSQSTNVKYTLSGAYNPMLTIYSIDGKKIREIKPGFQRPGIKA